MNDNILFTATHERLKAEVDGIQEAFPIGDAPDDLSAALYHGMVIGASMLADRLTQTGPEKRPYADLGPFIADQAEMAVRMRNGDGSVARFEDMAGDALPADKLEALLKLEAIIAMAKGAL